MHTVYLGLYKISPGLKETHDFETIDLYSTSRPQDLKNVSNVSMPPDPEVRFRLQPQKLGVVFPTRTLTMLRHDRMEASFAEETTRQE